MDDKTPSDFFDSKTYKEYEKTLREKEKYIKRGPNVIHIQYLKGLITENQILDYEKKLKQHGFELSRFDSAGVMYANFNAFELPIYLAISQPILIEILKTTGTNASWELIKYVTINIWRSVRNKSYYRGNSKNLSKQNVKFGLKVNLDKNTGFNLELKGDISESTIENSIDKILDFLREQPLKKEYSLTDYARFDAKKNRWLKIDVENEIRKSISKRQQKEEE